jgi:hypothetical protein
MWFHFVERLKVEVLSEVLALDGGSQVPAAGLSRRQHVRHRPAVLHLAPMRYNRRDFVTGCHFETDIVLRVWITHLH